jgi:hypothetical protein
LYTKWGWNRSTGTLCKGEESSKEGKEAREVAEEEDKGKKHWCLHQLDVKNAFLHGDLTEDIYMRPPAGLFSTPTSAVCKLRRSLYGLKQAPRAWYERFTSVLLQFDFLKSK